MMNILGLTGSVAMGKSTVADMFRDLGVPVHDADASVHALYSDPAFAARVDALFPGTMVGGVIDRARLGSHVLNDTAAMASLEKLVHPAVHAMERDFLADQRAAASPLVVLDIPLLFETGGADRCTHVAVVSAPADMQRARALARPGMTVEKFEAILSRQVSDAEKRACADIVIDTGTTLDDTRAQVKAVVEKLAPGAARP